MIALFGYVLILLLFYLLDRWLCNSSKAKEILDGVSVKSAAFSFLVLGIVNLHLDARKGSLIYVIASGGLACLKIRSWCHFWSLLVIQVAGGGFLLWYHLHHEVNITQRINDEMKLEWLGYLWYGFHVVIVVGSHFMRFLLLPSNQQNGVVKYLTCPLTFAFGCWISEEPVLCCPSGCVKNVPDIP